MKLLSVSQLARRTGVTVRTLHHYEACGLLQPAVRSAAGYRLYGEAELRRLQHIVSLKALGLTLDAIRGSLDRDEPSLAEALRRQTHRLRETIAHQHALLLRLENLQQRLAAGEAIDGDILLKTIEASTIMEKYLTAEQQHAVRQRGEVLGAARIREVEQTWPQVIAGMTAAMRLDKDPASEEVQTLAAKWRALLREFTGGDAGVQHSLNRMFRAEPATMRQHTGIDPALMAYACRAIAALPGDA
jgi:Predicted transcriptional regulators